MHQLPSSPTPYGPASPEMIGIPVAVTVIDTAQTTDTPTVGVSADSMYPPYVPDEVDAEIVVDSPALGSPTDRLAIGPAEQIEEPDPNRVRSPESPEEHRLAEDVARLWDAATATDGTVSIAMATRALNRPGDSLHSIRDYIHTKGYQKSEDKLHPTKDQKFGKTDPAPELTRGNELAGRYAGIELIRELMRHVDIAGYPEVRLAMLNVPMSPNQAINIAHPGDNPELFQALLEGTVSDKMVGELMDRFGGGAVKLDIPSSTPRLAYISKTVNKQILNTATGEGLGAVRNYWEQTHAIWQDIRENTAGGVEFDRPTLDDELKTVAYMARHYATRGTATRLAPIVMPVGSEPKHWRRPLLHADGTPPKYYPDQSNGYIQTGGVILPHWLGHRIWGARFAKDAPGLISSDYMDELKGRIQGSVVAAREAAKKEDPPRYLSNKEAETEGMTLFAWGINKLAFSPVRKAGIAESYSHDDARNATKHIEDMLKELLYPSDPTRLRKLGRNLVDIGFSKKAAKPFDGMVIRN